MLSHTPIHEYLKSVTMLDDNSILVILSLNNELVCLVGF